jgi:hypothetical protein
MEERCEIWRLAVNILNQPQTADKVWSSSLEIGQGANNCWCIVIALNVHAPGQEKSDRFDGELEQVFDHIPKYHMKILLGDFRAKLGIKLTVVNGSLHQDSNDNGVRIVNFTTSKISLKA